VFEHAALPDPTFVTTLSGNFYDKTGTLAMVATSGDSNERIESNTKGAWGFSGGGFGLVLGFDELELKLAAAALATGGTIHELFTGTHRNERFVLDRKAVIQADVQDCEIVIKSGDFLIDVPSTKMSWNKILFDDGAARIIQLKDILDAQAHGGRVQRLDGGARVSFAIPVQATART
jgi:hypothetical protein